ncbi:MAG: hypothetical protein KAV68_05165 [Dehalococcoidales bacterium]|nr:hypothetical protein [Dehalococcoidales bacterium]
MRGKKWFILLASLALVLLASSIGVTSSSLVDLESSTGNTFQAWTSREWVQTTEDDFNAGVLNQVDTSSSPGDVKLATIPPPTLVGSWAGETDFDTNGFNYTPGAGSNRVALVMVTAEGNSIPVANINQVTLGGQALTAIENADGVVVGSAGFWHNFIWFGYLDETGIGNMSGNALNITWDTTPTNSPPIMVQAATYLNVDQTTPIADSASNTNTAAGSIQAGSVSVGSDDRLVYVTTCGQPSDHTAPGGYTEQIEQDGPGASHSNASVQRDATTSSAENPTATWSGINRLAIISAVLNAVENESTSPPTLVGSWAGETDFDTNGFNYTPGAGSNRVALVMITAESNSIPVANINQVTLGGQALTAIENTDGVVVGSAGFWHNLIWFGYLDETGIGNMSGNALNITWDTAPTNSPPIMVQAATYQNVDQTTPIADSASNTNTAAGSIQAGSVSVGSNDRLVYVTTCGQPSDHTALIGYTEQVEQDGGPVASHSNASVQRDATTSGTENPTATWGGINRLAIISAVLNAAAGGPSYTSPGTIASQVWDTGVDGARWDGLFWDEILPSNTNITFEVRASDTLFAKDAPDATLPWISVGGTSPVTSGLPAGRYMQWRATLTTSDTSETPILQEVRVYHY